MSKPANATEALRECPREPTEAMYEAAWPIYNDRMTCKNIWRAMFDAAPVLATAPAGERPNEEIAMSSGTLREVARWLDTGKGRRPDGCTLRCIADVIDRLEPSSPPSGEMAALIERLLSVPDNDNTGLHCAYVATEHVWLDKSAPPKEVAALIERLHGIAIALLKQARDWAPGVPGRIRDEQDARTIVEAADTLARLAAPVPARELSDDAVINAVYQADNKTHGITRVSKMTPEGWKATTIFDGDKGLLAFARLLIPPPAADK